jgi:hypothetical protein
MVYLLAIILSVIICVFAFASEVTAGNIGHLRNGRQPNAGAALFPLIPSIQLLAVAIAWLLEKITPEYTIWILLSGFLVITVLWALSFVKLRAEFARATEERQQ